MSIYDLIACLWEPALPYKYIIDRQISNAGKQAVNQSTKHNPIPSNRYSTYSILETAGAESEDTLLYMCERQWDRQ